MPISVTWDPPSDADLAPDSPRKAASLKKIRDMGIFLYEWMGGLNYTPAVDHDHDGLNSRLVGTPVSPNFIQNSCPQEDAEEGWFNSSGVSISAEIGYEFSGGAGETLYQTFGNSPSSPTENAEMFGTNGNDWVLSFFAKANGVAAGELRFGFSNGSTTTFMTGCRGLIPGTSLSTNWKRFWMKLADKPSGAWGTPRFLLRVESALGTSFWASGFCVYIGNVLVPFNFCPIDNSDHDGYRRLSDDVPVWDKRVALTNAVLITPA